MWGMLGSNAVLYQAKPPYIAFHVEFKEGKCARILAVASSSQLKSLKTFG